MKNFIKHAYDLGSNLALHKHAEPTILSATALQKVPEVSELIQDAMQEEELPNAYLSEPAVDYAEPPEDTGMRDLTKVVKESPVYLDLKNNSLLVRGNF